MCEGDEKRGVERQRRIGRVDGAEHLWSGILATLEYVINGVRAMAVEGTRAQSAVDIPRLILSERCGASSAQPAYLYILQNSDDEQVEIGVLPSNQNSRVGGVGRVRRPKYPYQPIVRDHINMPPSEGTATFQLLPSGQSSSLRSRMLYRMSVSLFYPSLSEVVGGTTNKIGFLSGDALDGKSNEDEEDGEDGETFSCTRLEAAAQVSTR